MAAIREKEGCIALLQGPPDSLKEKIDILARQKEQLRHRLLTQNSEAYSTGADATSPYLGNIWLAAQQPAGDADSLVYSGGGTMKAPYLGAGMSSHHQYHVQPPYSSYVAAGAQNGKCATSTILYISPFPGIVGIMAGAPTSQVSIAIPSSYNLPSGPGKFIYKFPQQIA